MARTHLRTITAAGLALGLGLLAITPASAATGSQAGATALYLAIAGQGNGTGVVTAKYENGKETKTGETKPAFPQPAQDSLKGGVLAQEATAKPGFSAACAGLAGDGGSVLNIGDSSCLKPGKLLNGSLGSLNLASLIKADPSKFPGYDQLPPSVTGPLNQVAGALGAGQKQFEDAVSQALGPAIADAQSKFGSGGLDVDLDAIQGRCTAGDGGPTGTSTLTNARIALSGIPGHDPITIVDFPTDPAPNTPIVTNLAAVIQLVVNAIKTDLTSSFGSQSGPLKDALTQATQPIVDNIKTQLQGNLKPVEQNLISGTLNEQDHPTPDSIKVRALDLQIGTAEQLKQQVGASLIDLQVGDAACAPIASAVVSPPQASTPKVAAPRTPTGVSAGLATMPGHTHQHGIDASTWALMALAGLGLVGSAVVGIRRVVG